MERRGQPAHQDRKALQAQPARMGILEVPDQRGLLETMGHQVLSDRRGQPGQAVSLVRLVRPDQLVLVEPRESVVRLAQLVPQMPLLA